MGPQKRDSLLQKLERGRFKSEKILSSLSVRQLEHVVHDEPETWTVRDLIAHFVSAEENLLHLAQAALRGERGVPEDFNYDAFNHEELTRLRDVPSAELLVMLTQARQATIDWVQSLNDDQLGQPGWHPVLGQVNIEQIIMSIYAHQLIHMREAMSLLS